jgi:hypothetical protein
MNFHREVEGDVMGCTKDVSDGSPALRPLHVLMFN